MKDYLVRQAELVVAGGPAGGASYVAQHGLDLSAAGLRALLVAVGMAAYGVLVKRLGDRERPTVK